VDFLLVIIELFSPGVMAGLSRYERISIGSCHFWMGWVRVEQDGTNQLFVHG